MSAPLVFVITLNWNRRDDTLACLESLSHLAYSNARVLVVDNGSTDGSPQAIAREFPQVEQIVNPRNFGFAGGFNVGLRHALDAGADFAFILNNDTIAARDILDPLVAAAAPGEVGVVAPAIFYASDPERVWSTGGGRNRLTLEMTGDHGRHATLAGITEREFLSGCAMCIKRSVLERVGLFDEEFFMYYEDSDYCLRARRAGFRLLVVPQARVWHKVATSSDGSDSPAERYWMGRSSVRFFRKHARGWQWLAIIPWRVGSTIKTVLRLGSAGRWAAAHAYLRGVWEGIRAG
jgi:GT2 family glycosyltransferase